MSRSHLQFDTSSSQVRRLDGKTISLMSKIVNAANAPMTGPKPETGFSISPVGVPISTSSAQSSQQSYKTPGSFISDSATPVSVQTQRFSPTPTQGIKKSNPYNLQGARRASSVTRPDSRSTVSALGTTPTVSQQTSQQSTSSGSSRPNSANYRSYKSNLVKDGILVPNSTTQQGPQSPSNVENMGIIGSAATAAPTAGVATTAVGAGAGIAQQQPSSLVRTNSFLGRQVAQQFKNFTGDIQSLPLSAQILAGSARTQQDDGSALGTGVGAVPVALAASSSAQLAIDTLKSLRSSTDSHHQYGGSSVAGTTEGTMLVYVRRPEERRENPERLNLDRRGLEECPLLESEEKLKLLNYQYNSIAEIRNLHNLPNLIFLDFYNNNIERIENLHLLTSLRVLMLGKNKIRRIENLDALKQLDVLDLHSNEIEKLENISHLKGLRVLNLAGNRIRTVDNVLGLTSLTEINLRRNQIEVIKELDLLPNLQRVFLSNNSVKRFDDLDCIFHMRNLMELSLDGNAVVNNSFYRQYILEKIKTLRHLDMKRITDDERKTARALSKKTEESIRATIKEDKEREKQDVVQVIEEHWMRFLRFLKRKRSSSKGSGDSSTSSSSGSGSSSTLSSDSKAALEEISRRAFTDVDGSRMTVNGDADILPEKHSQTVEALEFRYVQFSTLVRHYFPKLKKFTNLKTLVLHHNNLCNLNELYDLKVLSHLEHLEIVDNPICRLVDVWLPYCVVALPDLKTINGTPTYVRRGKDQLQDIFAKKDSVFKDFARLNTGLCPEAEKDIPPDTSTTAIKYVENVLQHAHAIDNKMKTIDAEWDSVVESLIFETLELMTDKSKLEKLVLLG